MCNCLGPHALVSLLPLQQFPSSPAMPVEIPSIVPEDLDGSSFLELVPPCLCGFQRDTKRNPVPP